MDRFQAMEVFARVVELGGFTKASDSLHLPKATVTNLVQALEAHLRVRLLHRTTRQVRVTPDGAAYYERVVRILQEVQETEAQVANATATPSGRLRIDVPGSVGRRVITPALPTFFEKYPDIALEMGCTDRPVDLVEEGVDCVIRGGDLHDESLVARRIGEMKIVTVASPSYLAKHGTPKRPEELKDHIVVNYFSSRTGKVFDLDFTKDGERINIAGRHHVAVNDGDAYTAAGLAGLGILQVPTLHVQEHIASGELVIVLGEWLADGLPLYVMYPQNRHLSAKVRVFVEWVSDLFAESDLIQVRSSWPPKPKAAIAPVAAPKLAAVK